MTVGQRLRHKAAELGFAKCGIARSQSLDAVSKERFLRWIGEGFHGEMGYMARQSEKRLDPSEVLAGSKSVISVLVNYFTSPQHSDDALTGAVSRYAWGRDYHLTVKEKLRALNAFLSSLVTSHSSIFYVDTGPLLDKWWAQRAGLGWIGKNSNLITPEIGSWVFVGEILTTVEFTGSDYDASFEHPSAAFKREDGIQYGKTPSIETQDAETAPKRTLCGSCRRCLEVCPTGAIVAPFVVDSRKCISYLTIELRGPIPREFRRGIGNRIFGCDDCQDVCPWNRFAAVSYEQAFHPDEGNLTPSLIELLSLTQEEFNRRFKNSAIRRARYSGFLRNVAVALGNSHRPEAVPALESALQHVEALVRQHAAWALGEIGNPEAIQALRSHLAQENNADVRKEIEAALQSAEKLNGDGHQR
ncbi:MAG: tRNA epoxyqueuosine(34) reductase QueG [Acidobacteriia bacterium]|nr:tRNA epoxyqueuosine(34) reductase QueG [Terriglobia bacterium]